MEWFKTLKSAESVFGAAVVPVILWIPTLAPAATMGLDLKILRASGALMDAHLAMRRTVELASMGMNSLRLEREKML